MSLTKSLCRRQDKRIVIENYEAAVKVVWTAEEGVHPVSAAQLARAKRQLAICRAELIKRKLPVDYKPKLEPHEISMMPRQWSPEEVAPADGGEGEVATDKPTEEVIRA